MTPPRPLVHDCDPGIDDAVALLLALHSPELSVQAVTTTHGNVPLSATTRNGLDLLAFAGRPEVPLYPGALSPLVRAPIYAPQIHGEGGLGDVDLPAAAQPPQPLHAALALTQLSERFPGQLTVCATGPLSNLALAERLDPGFLGRLREVVIMGGSLDAAAPRLGNTTPFAEFNTYADPHALRVLLDAGTLPGVRLVLFGLNLTRQVRVTRERAAALAALNTPAAQLCAEMLGGYLDRIEPSGQRVGALHDPCTVAYLLRPDLFSLEAACVQVNIDEGERYGMTTRADGPANIQVATRADEDGVWALLGERLE